MRSKRMLALVAVGAIALTTFVTVQRNETRSDAPRATALRAYSLTLGAPPAQARRAFRSVTRAFSAPFRAVARLATQVSRAVVRVIPPVIKRLAAPLVKVIRNVTKAAVSVVKKVGDGVIAGVKKMGQGVVKIGQGVVQVAKGVAKVAVGVVKSAVAFTGGLVQAGGKLLKGDLKGAFNEVKAGASKAVNIVKTDVVAGLKDVGKGLVKIADGVKDVALGAIEALNPLGKLAWDWLQKNFGGFLMKAIGSNIMGHIGKIASVVSSGAGKLISAMNTLASILKTAQEVLNAIQNPEEYVDKGKEWVAEKLTALAWRVIEGPIKKVAGGLISALVGFVKHFITTPLTAMLSAALASVTFGIGALAAPLIKMAIDKLMDLAIDALSDKLAELAMGIDGIRNFIKNKLIRPAIDKLYDVAMNFLKKKFPKIFDAAAKILAKAKEVAGKASEVIGKVQNVVGKVTDIAGKIQAAAGSVNKGITDAKTFLATQTPAKLTSRAKISVSALIPPAAVTEIKNIANLATKAKELLKNAPKKLAEAIKNPASLLKILPPSMTRGITDVKNIMRTVVDAVKSPKKLLAIVKDAKDAVTKVVTNIIPNLVAKVKSVAVVIKEEAPAGEVEVKESENPAEAPVVTPAPEADTDGMRAGVKAVYSLMLEDWKSGLNAARSFGTNAGGLDIEIRRQLYPALVLYRRNLHDAARLAYNVRVLSMKQLYRTGIEEVVDAVTGALATEGAGASGRFDGKVESDEKINKDFDDAKNALSRLAQNGERFILAASEILTGRQQQIVKKVIATFGRLVSKARQGLEDASSVLAPPPAPAEEPAAEGEKAAQEGDAPAEGAEKPAEEAPAGAAEAQQE